jgi:hypothetical protein
MTAVELMYRVAQLLEGRRQHELLAKVGALLTEDLRNKVLPFDGPSAAHYAEIVA